MAFQKSEESNIAVNLLPRRVLWQIRNITEYNKTEVAFHQ